MNKHIILLNGPSSSGKSTLSRGLQAALAQTHGLRYAIVSIDDFLRMTTTDTIYEDDVFEASLPLCESAREQLATHDGVIIDHVITSPRIYEHLRDALAAHPLHTVRVTCPVEILRQREQARGNRCIGSAEASNQYLYPQDGYETTVDTHEMTAEDCFAAICARLTD